MKENERTLQMRKAFVALWQSGHTIHEIAEKFKLSDSTVYKNLQKIADENCLTRDELLEKPHAEHLTYDRTHEPVKPIDLDEFRKSITMALAALDKTCSQIEKEYEEVKR